MKQSIFTSTALRVLQLSLPIVIGSLYTLLKLHKNSRKLTQLPNELLMSILSRIPEIDLHRHVALVCTRFAHISSQTRVQRRQLWIEFGTVDNAYPRKLKMLQKFGVLKFDILTQQKCGKIVEIYSNVRELAVNAKIDITAEMDQSITDTLLGNGHWCDQLESLYLTIEFVRHNHGDNQEEIDAENIIRGRSIRRLVNLINQRMRSLRRLSINACVRLGTEPLHMPIIAQLEHFGFYSYDSADLIYASLIEYGARAESPLKRIDLFSKVLRDDRLVDLITNFSASLVNRLHINEDDFHNQRALLSKLTTLDLHECPVVELERLQDFFSPRVLSNLKHLSISWLLQDPLIHLIRALGPLTNDETQSKLDLLNLYFQTNDPAFHDPSLQDLSELVDFTTGSATCQLRSIKYVRVALSYQLPSHNDIRQLHLDLICHNLKTLQVVTRTDRCRMCAEANIDKYKCRWRAVERYWQMDSRPLVLFNNELFVKEHIFATSHESLYVTILGMVLGCAFGFLMAKKSKVAH